MLPSQKFFFSRNVHLDIIRVFYSPTDAQVNSLKNVIKIYIKTAPTSFGVLTPSSGSALFVLAKVTVVKIVNYDKSVWLKVKVKVALRGLPTPRPLGSIVFLPQQVPAFISRGTTHHTDA
jgi:hypothetical protein